jgi:hypothetical protein
MHHRIAALSLLLASTLTLACPGNPTWQEEASTNQPRAQVTVQFTDSTLSPEVAQVTRGGNVTWVNFASYQSGGVFLPASARDAFPCPMRPLFIEVTGGYLSIPVTGHGGEQVTLPCSPKPGEYDYQIQLYNAVWGDSADGLDDPLSVIHGKIKVLP